MLLHGRGALALLILVALLAAAIGAAGALLIDRDHGGPQVQGLSLTRPSAPVGGGAASLVIQGNVSAPFTPGSSHPVDLIFTNPYAAAITVPSVSVSVQPTTTLNGSPNRSCDGPANLSVLQGFTGPVTVPALSTKSLADLSVPQGRWPLLEMPDLPVSQDGCRNTTFHLTFTASGVTS